MIWPGGVVIVFVIVVGATVAHGWQAAPRPEPLWDLTRIAATFAGMVSPLAGFSVASATFLAALAVARGSTTFEVVIALFLIAFLILISSAMGCGSVPTATPSPARAATFEAVRNDVYMIAVVGFALGMARKWLPLVMALGCLLALPAMAAASVAGGCRATGTTEAGGTIDLTSTDVWHVRSTDRISISGTAPSPQTSASVRAHLLGFAIPISGGTTEDGDTAAQSDTFDVSTVALLGRIFVLDGASAGAADGCSGQVELVIDDVNPLLTALGIGSVVAAVLGVLAVAWAAAKPTSVRRRIGGLIGLALLGASASVLLQQTSTPGEAADIVPSSWVSSVAGPTQVTFDGPVLAQVAALAVLITLLMPFPADLFNRASPVPGTCPGRPRAGRSHRVAGGCSGWRS